MNTKKYIYSILVLAIMGSFVLSAPVLAENNGQKKEDSQRIKVRMMNPGQPTVFGTVSIVSGNIITISGKQGFGDDDDVKTTNTTFTIDATNAKVIKNGVASTVSNIAVGDTIMVQGTLTGTNVVATTIRDGKINREEMEFGKMMPNVVGKVSAINGNTLTVISQRRSNNNVPAASTIFTVDATNAKVLRGQTVGSVSNIAIGDTVIVQGTVTGTNVVATTIRDGKEGNGNDDKDGSVLSQIQGNGQPVVAGTISVINGSNITITNNGNVAYIINASSAKILQGKNVIVLSDLKVGDSIIVQGTVNGTSVAASTIINQNNKVNLEQGDKNNSEKRMGFFGSIGNFFKRLFGF